MREARSFFARHLESLKSNGRSAFMPFVTCGYPSLASMRGILTMLRDGGADCVELGVPFSDPIADGATIQQASQVALEGGATPDDCLRTAELAARLGHRVALMSYANPLYRQQLPKLGRRLRDAGVSALIVPDLPLEEAARWRSVLEPRGVPLAMFAAPTTPIERLREAGRQSGAFLYYVSLTGVTGERSSLVHGLGRRLREVCRAVSAPVCVGFGVSTPAQVRALSPMAHGVIVGSALVRRLAAWTEGARQRRDIAAWIRRMARSTK